MGDWLTPKGSSDILLPAKRRRGGGARRSVLRSLCGAADRQRRAPDEIGRASCRARVCQDVLSSGVAVSLKQKNTLHHDTDRIIIRTRSCYKSYYTYLKQ